MAINFTRLFTTLGEIVGGTNEFDTFRGTTIVARTDDIFSRYTSVFQDLTSGLYTSRDITRSGMNTYLSYISSLASNTIIREVVADVPLVSQTLSACLTELNRQMVLGTETVENSPAALAVTNHLTDGNGVFSGTTLQTDGGTADLALPDTYLVTVPRGYGGGDRAYSEILSVAGQNKVVPSTQWDWPGGSGVTTSLVSQDPALNIGLLNGSLSDGTTSWTTDPSLTITTALADNPRSESTATVVKLANSSGGTLATRIIQTVTPNGNTVYAYTIKVKRTTNSNAFTFDIKLVSATLGTLNTIAAVASTDLTLNTWVQLSGFFVTPTTIGTGAITIKFGSESLHTGEAYELCHAALYTPQPLYTGGPSVVHWAGSLPMTKNDYYSAAVTIGGTGALQRGIDRLIDIRNQLPNGLPSTAAATPATQPDSLIS